MLARIVLARKEAPGWDVYALEREWRDWSRGKPTPKDVDKAFLGFCRGWFRQRGSP